MSDEKEPRVTVAEVVREDEMPEWAKRMFKDATEDQALARVVIDQDRSYIERLAMGDEAVKIIDRRAEMLARLRVTAIRSTDPENWILNKDRDGREIAMPDAVAGRRIAEVYGVQIEDLRPLSDDGIFKPEKDISEDDRKLITLTGYAWAYSVVTKMRAPVKASRRSDERFLGRQSRWEEGKEVLDYSEADHSTAVLTLLLKKGALILSGLAKVPRTELESTWALGSDKKKTTDRCTKGHGYGSGGARDAQKVAEAGAPEKAEELWNEIVRRAGGEMDVAKQILKDVTANPPKFGGFTDHKRLTQGWQVKTAYENLKKHPTWGDQPEPGSAE